MNLRLLLPRLWRRRNLLAALLLPFSLLFYLLIFLRQLAYHAGLLRVGRLPVPVIVVGNIMVGGSGKTPLVVWLFEALRAAGKKPGIISRGYGGTGSAAGMLVSADTPATIGGDEPCLLARLTGQPVAIGRDRVAAAQLLLRKLECDVLISDDGLQHTRLPRRFEIVVFDTRGAGNGWLLPAGPLREPRQRLQRVDALVFNHGPGNKTLRISGLPENQPPQFQMQLQPQDAWQLIAPAQRRDLASFKGQPILAAAGIGHPARFFAMLQNQGLQIATLPLPDHYDFSANPFSAHPAETILITEKDAVKCQALNDARIWVVPVRATVQASAATTSDLLSIVLEKLTGF